MAFIGHNKYEDVKLYWRPMAPTLPDVETFFVSALEYAVRLPLEFISVLWQHSYGNEPQDTQEKTEETGTKVQVASNWRPGSSH